MTKITKSAWHLLIESLQRATRELERAERRCEDVIEHTSEACECIERANDLAGGARHQLGC